VAAADEIEPHLAARKWVYVLPTVHPRNGPPAAFVVLDASIPSEPVEPHVLHSLVEHLMAHGYGVQFARDGVLILRRGLHQRTLPPAFYSFIFTPSRGAVAERARWGSLRLAAVTIHPGNLSVDRSRPAVGVEMFWRAGRAVPSATRITVYLSPVYSGPHPAFSTHWTAQGDSPTWDWLSPRMWPVDKPVRAAVPPLLPQRYVYGSVDVAVGVSGTGPLRAPPSGRVRGAPNLLRVATVSVDRVGA
jgi:hypothetical protein